MKKFFYSGVLAGVVVVLLGGAVAVVPESSATSAPASGNQIPTASLDSRSAGNINSPSSAGLFAHCRLHLQSVSDARRDFKRGRVFARLICGLETSQVESLLEESRNMGDPGLAGVRLMAELAAREPAAARKWLEKKPRLQGRQLELFCYGYVRGLARLDFDAAEQKAALLCAEYGFDKKSCRTQMLIELAELDSSAAWDRIIKAGTPVGRDLSEVASILAQESPDVLVRWINTFPPPDLDSYFFERVFQNLQSTGTSDAYRMVPTSGRGRELALEALAKTSVSSDPREMLLKLDKLSTAEGVKFISAWAATHPNTSLKLLADSPELRTSVFSGVCSWESALVRPGPANQAWKMMDEKEKLEVVSPMATAKAALDFPTFQEWLVSVPATGRTEALAAGLEGGFVHHKIETLQFVNSLNGDDFGVGVRAVASAWAGDEPNAAANWLFGLKNAEVFVPALEKVLPRWNTLDPAGMVQWVHAANLAPHDIVALMEPFSDSAPVAAYLSKPELAALRQIK